MRTAVDGLDALEVLSDYQADLLFVDMVMPKVSRGGRSYALDGAGGDGQSSFPDGLDGFADRQRLAGGWAIESGA